MIKRIIFYIFSQSSTCIFINFHDLVHLHGLPACTRMEIPNIADTGELNAEIPPITETQPEPESTTPSNTAQYEDDYPIPDVTENVTPAPAEDVTQSPTEETTQGDTEQPTVDDTANLGTDQQTVEETTQGDKPDVEETTQENFEPVSPPTDDSETVTPAPETGVNEDMKAWLNEDIPATDQLVEVAPPEQSSSDQSCNCTGTKVGLCSTCS